MKKRKRNNIVFAVFSAALIVLLVALPFRLEEKHSSTAEVKIVSSAAETGSISKTLSGTGTLTAQEAEDVLLPAGVEITRYAADNGDIVTAGEALAYVDRVTVLQAISACEETLEHIEEQMTAVKNNAASECIAAPAVGTVKTVYAKDGDDVRQVMLEHGALAVLEIEGKEWKAQAYTGTVFHASTAEGKTVYPGTALFYLSDTTDSSAYELLAAQHREYEDIMHTLAVLYQDGVISAPCSGAVSGIDEEEAAKLQSEYNRRHSITAETIAAINSLPNYTMQPYYTGRIIKISFVAGDRIEYQALPDIIPISADTDLATLTSYYYMAYGIDSTVATDELSLQDTKIYDVNLTEYTDSKISDVLLLFDEPLLDDGYKYALYLGNLPQENPGGNGGNGNHTGGNNGNFSSENFGDMTRPSSFSSIGGSSSSEKEEEFVMYSSEGSICMSVTPQDTVSISITVDELDVLSVQNGAEAKLTIDALPGREYTGTVTAVNRIATNSGGNSKYTAEITFPREDTMLAGMNASSLITVSTAENVLMLPAEALTEDGLRTLVYTAFDEKTGLLSGEKEVKTGVSDGENVQILSGISEGETVYYAYEDTIELETLFGRMMPGGNIPSGGGLPGRN